VKYLTGLVLAAALLTACDLGATTPSEEPLPSIGASSMAVSPSAAATTGESPVAMACTDAFASIDTDAIIAMGSLAAVVDELDATLLACSNIDEWESAAESALPGLDIGDARLFVAARCAEVSSLAGAAICTEVAS
jgi:activator of HSP90 ATPase